MTREIKRCGHLGCLKSPPHAFSDDEVLAVYVLQIQEMNIDLSKYEENLKIIKAKFR